VSDIAQSIYYSSYQRELILSCNVITPLSPCNPTTEEKVDLMVSHRRYISGNEKAALVTHTVEARRL
jgi:hypothetical protein